MTLDDRTVHDRKLRGVEDCFDSYQQRVAALRRAAALHAGRISAKVHPPRHFRLGGW